MEEGVDKISDPVDIASTEGEDDLQNQLRDSCTVLVYARNINKKMT